MQSRLNQAPTDANASPTQAKGLMVLAEIDAYLGRAEEAQHEGQKALEMLPPQRDAIDGARMAAAYARVAALGPDSARAVAAVRAAAEWPAAFYYGQLLLDPVWDSIRKDPVFSAVLAEYAPKDSAP